MMLEGVVDRISRIFVGRLPELQRLSNLWDMACIPGEHRIYVMLNAPGIGKTTLMNHFGTQLHVYQKGLYLEFGCKKEYDSPSHLLKDLLKSLQNTLEVQKSMIQTYLSQGTDPKLTARKMKRVYTTLDHLLDKSPLTLNDVYDIFNDVANVIPIFFAADEIQEFQKLTFRQTTDHPNEESALHFFTHLLKMLLRSRILFILSGTRYHILNQIGYKIGSPIREKVEVLVLSKFDQNDIINYVKEVRSLIFSEIAVQSQGNASKILENLTNFLAAFAWGHPRTIAKITSLLLNHFQSLLSLTENLEYPNFVDYLLPIAKDFFQTSLLSADISEALHRLTANELFPVLKQWIITQGSKGEKLGQIPEILQNPDQNLALKELVYSLVNMGLILQNGNNNYYLTSYFHFLEFLRPFTESYDLFLKEILNNRYFYLMCGRQSGFGYTFETIILNTILSSKSLDNSSSILPINPALLREIIVISGEFNWSIQQIQSNKIYHTPNNPGIDFIIFQESILYLGQITTANPPSADKISKFLNTINTLHHKIPSEINIPVIRGWFITLFPPPASFVATSQIIWTGPDELKKLLGPSLFDKLVEVKNSYNI
jgi:hypothetical protein